MSATDLPLDFDILSIDKDSYGLEVWDLLCKFTPKIVVIEINSEYPPGPIFIKSKGGEGGSFTAAFNLGQSKGFSLICYMGNLIFKRRFDFDVRVSRQIFD